MYMPSFVEIEGVLILTCEVRGRPRVIVVSWFVVCLFVISESAYLTHHHHQHFSCLCLCVFGRGVG